MNMSEFVVSVITPSGKDHRLTFKEPVSVEKIAHMVRKDCPYLVLVARIDNEVKSLKDTISSECNLELLDIRTDLAFRIYLASLSFMYVEAVRNLFGEDTQVVFENSLTHSVYTTIRTSGINSETPRLIEKEMRKLAQANLPFIEEVMSRDELMDYLRENNLKQDLRLLESAKDIKEAKMYTLNGHKELCFHDLLPSTGYLKWFKVRRYKNGMLLRYPQPTSPTKVPAFEDQKKLYLAFAENTRWGKLMGIENATLLNETITNGNAKDLILLSEALQEKKIAEIASTIAKDKKRLVLIAGPTSSGKTTFAKRLTIQLRVNGVKPLYLGTDDYFKERHETPIGEDGEKDYESLRALDLDLFHQNMNDLIDGKKVDLPRFDFIEGTKVYGERITTIDHSQPIVMEGIHALNPELSKTIDDDKIYKIYISPLTQLNIDDHNRISITSARMLRRIVRDYKFRGNDAEKTILSWKKIREGEEVYIFPYNDEADIFFNSHLLYELAILKKYAKPQLEMITKDSPAYGQAQVLLNLLKFFVTIEDEDLVPNNSIMREFIGGSIII